MSELGPVVYGQQNGDYHYSQATAEKIDAEVKKILEQSYHKALELLKINRDKLDLLSNTLLEKETMYAGEIYELLAIAPRTEHTFS
jgi:cell division protease FtsH